MASLAATFTWDGGGANNNFSAANNWNPNGAPPTATAATDLVFSGGTRFNPVAEAAYALNSLVFSGTTFPFSISGEQITFQTSGSAPLLSNQGAQSATLNNVIAFDSSGTIRAQSGNMTLSNTLVTPASGQTVSLTADTGRTLTMSAVGGAGNVTANGAGTVRLNGVMIHSGALLVSGGTLEIDTSVAGPSSTTVSSGGTIKLLSANRIASMPISIFGNLDLNSFQETIGPLSGSGNINLGTAGDLTIAQNVDTSFTGNISASGFANALKKDGSGTLSLGGSTTLNGTMAVNGGTLKALSGSAIPQFAEMAIADGATLDVNANSVTTATLTGKGTLHLPAASAFSTGGSNNDSFVYDGKLTGTGTVTKTGNGTMTLTSDNSPFTGSIHVSAGTLVVTKSSAMGQTGSTTVTSGATLQLNGNVTQARQGGLKLSGSGVGGVGAIHFSSTGAGPMSVIAPITLLANTTIISDAIGTSTLGINGLGLSMGTYSLTLSGAGSIDITQALSGTGELILNGNGTRELLGNNISFSGPVSGNDGVLELSHNAALGTGSQPVTIQSGAFLRLANGINLSTSRPLLLQGSGSYLTTSNQATASWSGSGMLTANGSYLEAGNESIFTISGSGGITANSGIRLKTGTDAIMNLNRDLSLVSGSLYKQSSGLLVVNGAISGTSGEINISGGTLKLGVPDRLPDALNVSIASGCTFDLENQNETISSLSGVGTVALGSATLTLTQTNSKIFSGDISGTSASKLVIDGAGGGSTQTLSSANSFTGSTQVKNGGNLVITANGALSPTSALAVDSGGVVQLYANGQVVGGLSGSGNINVIGVPSLLEVGTNTIGALWQGTISGAGGFVKHGLSTAIFTVSQPYTGPTSVLGGALQVNGLPASDVTVAAAAQLAAKGTVQSINCSGTLAVGSPGDLGVTLSVESLTMAQSSRIFWTLADWDGQSGVENDLIDVETLDFQNGPQPVTIGVEIIPSMMNYDGGSRTFTIAHSLASMGSPSFEVIMLLPNSAPVNDGTFSVEIQNDDVVLIFTPNGDTYESWISGYAVGTEDGFGDDFDNDGLSNGIEYVLGGNPQNVDDSALLPTVSVDATHLEFIFRRTTRSEYLNPSVEHSLNLAPPWTTAIHGTNGVTISVEDLVPVDSEVKNVIVRIPKGMDLKRFARLKVELPISSGMP